MAALSPGSKPVKKYYDTLARLDGVGAVHEQAVKTAFHEVLQQAAGKRYTVVPEGGGLGEEAITPTES